MTFKELNEKLGGNENESDWRQAKGGGWIHKSATVEREDLITENAIVWSGRVSGDARVSGNAQVYGNARVYGDARVSGDARVYGDAWEKSPLFIIGSRFSLTNAKKGHIQIGCQCKTFDWWLKNGKRLAKECGFTEAEVKEYTAYVKLFKAIGK